MPTSRSELEQSLRSCLLDRVRAIDSRLPTAPGLADVFDDPEAIDDIASSSSEVARAVGWIEGAADALDLTVIELLDAADIPLDPRS